MRLNYEDMEQYYMHKSNNHNRHRSEYRDSVDEFISRHSVTNDCLSTDNIQQLRRDLLNYNNVNKHHTQSNSKLAENIDTEIFVSKIIKYNRRLDKVIVKLMKSLKSEREQSELKQIIDVLQEKHKRNVMSLAKDSYKKLLKAEESFIDDSDNRKLLLKPSADRNWAPTDRRYVQSENMIGCIKELKRQNTCHTNGFRFPRSSCTNTINLHRDDGQTNLYLSMNSMTIGKLNRQNHTLYPTIRVPYEKNNFIPKRSFSKADSKAPGRDRSVIRSISQQRTVSIPHRLDKITRKSVTNTCLKTKIDDLAETINLLIEEIQGQKSSKVDKKIETMNEDKDSNKALNNLKTKPVHVEGKHDASVNTTVSIVCARSPKIEMHFDLAKFRNKFRGNIIASKSGTRMTTHTVKQTASIGLMATVATSDKSVDIRPYTSEEASVSLNEGNVTTLTKGTNTDPLGVFALLRVSAESINQLISNMPSIDFCSYLPFHSSNYLEQGDLPFVCEICGAAFNKASLLNNHIKNHDLGFARNCGVCQRLLNTEMHGGELYKCRYCGQRFTRANCRELHQQSCAKRFGVHDSARLRRDESTSNFFIP